jgi:tRNA(Ile)-lysidine synthase
LIPPLFDIPAAPDLCRWFSAWVRQEGLLSPGDRVLAAVSGGPDSVALLHLLVRAGLDLGLSLGVAHFDHGLRGADSDDDAAFAARLAQELGLPFHLGTGDVRREARERKISLQMAARDLRLPFLKETCRLHGYHKLALGHTADDQVEQFLLRLLRGTGLEGLKGMRFTAPDGLVRPLLAVGKEVLLAWLRREALPYREDASNLNRRYLRNRVRLELLPVLARFNPQVKTAVWRLMSRLEEDERLLARQTAQAWEMVGRMVTPDFACLDLAALLALPSGLEKRTLRYALGMFAGGQEINAAQVENILSLGRAHRSGGRIDFRECQAARAGRELHIWRRLPPPPADAVAVLPAPGVWDTPAGWRFLLSLSPYAEDFSYQPAPGAVCLDGGQASLPLTVRYSRPGDRFWPRGGPGTRKLQDFLVDSKIPRWLRPHLPLVESNGRIIWVAGLRPAEYVRVAPHTHTVLLLRLFPANSYTARVWQMLMAWRSQMPTGQQRSPEAPPPAFPP